MQFRTVFGTDSSLAVGMTLLVTIDAHRVSALVSPSGADPLLRSLRQGAGAQDDREQILQDDGVPASG